MNKIKNGAFTLSEVLITLGIIGIVAAMTMPTLISSYRKKTAEARLQRVYSLMNQAIKLSSIDNGEPEAWHYVWESDNPTVDAVEDWFKLYLAPYLKYLKTEKLSSVFRVYLNDGSVLQLQTNKDILFFVDGHCIKSNSCKQGVDSFLFGFWPKKSGVTVNERNKNAWGAGFQPYAYGWDGTVEGAKHDTNGGSSKMGCYDDTGYAGNGQLCAKLIQLNGWKIPSDYPKKF